MNKNKFYAIVILGLLLSNCILIFFITQKGHNSHFHTSPREIVIQRLKLDASQIIKYEQLIQVHRGKTHELMKGIQEGRNDLYSQITRNGELTIQAALFDSIASNQAELEELNYSHFQEIKNLCTSNQLDDLEALSKDLAKIFAKGEERPKHRPKK
jgi:protein CpxP